MISSALRNSKVSWSPAIYFAIIGVAQLAVFWFEAYRILSLAFLLLCIPLALQRLQSQKAQELSKKVLWCFLAIYAYMSLAVFWAPRPYDASLEIAKAFAVSIPPFIFGLMLARRFNMISIACGLGAIPVAFFIQVLYNIYVYEDAMRIDQFNIRTQLAGLICFILPLLLAHYFSSTKFINLVSLLFAGTLAILLAAQSRSTLLILAPALLILVRAHNRKLFLIYSILMMAAAAIAISLLISGGSIGRFSPEDTSFEISDAVVDELLEKNEEGVDLERRAHAFIATTLFLQNPITGSGYSSVLQTFIDQLSIEVPSHGFIPGTLAELGIIGISLIIYFSFCAFRLISRITKQLPIGVSLIGKGYSVGFGSLIAFGFFHQTFEWAYFPLFVGLLLGAPHFAEQAARQSR